METTNKNGAFNKTLTKVSEINFKTLGGLYKSVIVEGTEQNLEETILGLYNEGCQVIGCDEVTGTKIIQS